MRITAQQHLIEDILDAISTSSYGIGITLKCDVKFDLKGDNSYIDFIPREGETIEVNEWFWFGYHIR